MPAQIVIVLDEQDSSDRTAAMLQAAGYEAASLPDSMAALDALEGAARVEVLVTCVDHGTGKPNGVALARMARYKRPGIRILFVGAAEFAEHTDDLGVFMPSPVTEEDVKDAVVRILEAD
jgi:two-component SAPR family response regulator